MSAPKEQSHLKAWRFTGLDSGIDVDASVCVTSRVFYLDVTRLIVTLQLNPETRTEYWFLNSCIPFSVVYVPLNVVIISKYLDKYNEQQTISCTSMVSFVVVSVTKSTICAQLLIGYQLWLYYLQIVFVDALCHDHKTRKPRPQPSSCPIIYGQHHRIQLRDTIRARHHT